MKSKFEYVLFASLVSLGIAFLVLIGWAFDVRLLKSVLPGYITMKVNTALCFALLSTALLLLRRKTRWRQNVALAFALATIVVCGATLIQYLTNLDFKIDELLVTDHEGVGGRFPPGRLAPITAVNFISLSLSFILGRFSNRRVVILSQLLAVMVLFASFQGLVGYGIGLTYLFGSAFYTQMALHTAVCFVLLSTGKLLLESEKNFIQDLHSFSHTARMTRWMLVTAVVIPPLVQWGARFGFNHQLYDQDFSQLIQVVGTTALMAILIISAGTAFLRNEGQMRQKQMALKESEEKFRALIEVSAQIVWSATETGDIIDDSPSWRAYTGQTYEQWEGRGWLNALHPHDQGRTAHAWQEATRMKRSYQVEYRVKHRSGEWRWMLARGTPILNDDNSIRGWVGMNADIHQRKLIELDLKNAKDEAEQANELKSAFLANMSHEIRTPLSAMIGFNDLLRDDGLSAADRKSFVDIVSRNGAQLLVLINDILDLSKVEAGQLSFDYLPTNPVEVLKETLSLLSVNGRGKTLDLNYKVGDMASAFLTTDSTRLKQILMNVIGNAIKFTNVGHVHVRIENWERNTERVGIRFEVEDTGIGILDTQKNHVFDMFVQADGSITRRFGGTGLGLSLSRRLARELGGDVYLKSTVAGAGTTFVILIEDRPEGVNRPAVQPVEPELRPTISMTPTSLRGIKILLVDDAADNRELITHHMTKLGAEVVACENGLLGVQATQRDDFDIILMDLQMPVMDGYTATRKIRGDGFMNPIIALTAHAMTEIRQKCLDVGCTDHLPKPINFAVLGRKIERFVKISRESRIEALSKV